MNALTNFLKGLTLAEFFAAMRVTGLHFLGRKVTVQYPEERIPQSPRFRGLHALRRYANGEARCIGCQLCEAVCPAVCITIETAPRDDDTRRTTRYDIDLFKCVYCGFCEEACPTDAIVLTRTYEWCYLERGHGEEIIRKDQLLANGTRLEAQIAADRREEARYR